jgi:peroxiredoxin
MYLVAYHLDDATIAKQKQYGVDLEATTGTTQLELPVPSVFVIDTTGTIRYYSNSGYKVRLASDALLAAELPYAPRNPNTNQIQ